MSWSIQLFGKASKIAAALDAHSEKLTGESRVEYDAAKPHLIGIVQQNFTSNETEALLAVTASGHGTNFGNDKKDRVLAVKVERVYGEILS